MQKTWMAKQEEVEDAERDWYFVDASGIPLGRLASEIATVLQGKHKPTYTPHVDVGDYVVVVNSGEVSLTGNKKDQKKYYRHSGYLGNLSQVSYRELLEEDPILPMKEAVRRMMPKNTLAREMMKKLKLYEDEDHPHDSVEFKELNL